MKLGDLVLKVRSKNAGPYWVTVDIFCGSRPTYDAVAGALDNQFVSALFGQQVDALKRFDISELHVIKFSFPRPVVQGSQFDRDMHGAQYSVLLAELELDTLGIRP